MLNNKISGIILFAIIIVIIFFLLKIQARILKKIIYFFETRYPKLDILPKSYFVKFKKSNFFYYSNLASWSNFYLLKNYSKLPKDIIGLFKKIILLWIICIVVALILICVVLFI